MLKLEKRKLRKMNHIDIVLIFTKLKFCINSKINLWTSSPTTPKIFKPKLISVRPKKDYVEIFKYFHLSSAFQTEQQIFDKVIE